MAKPSILARIFGKFQRLMISRFSLGVLSITVRFCIKNSIRLAMNHSLKAQIINAPIGVKNADRNNHVAVVNNLYFKKEILEFTTI